MTAPACAAPALPRLRAIGLPAILEHRPDPQLPPAWLLETEAPPGVRKIVHCERCPDGVVVTRETAGRGYYETRGPEEPRVRTLSVATVTVGRTDTAPRCSTCGELCEILYDPSLMGGLTCQRCTAARWAPAVEGAPVRTYQTFQAALSDVMAGLFAQPDERPLVVTAPRARVAHESPIGRGHYAVATMALMLGTHGAMLGVEEDAPGDGPVRVWRAASDSPRAMLEWFDGAR
jgi:hypothetical protein